MSTGCPGVLAHGLEDASSLRTKGRGNLKGQSLCLQLEILVLGELLESVQLLSSETQAQSCPGPGEKDLASRLPAVPLQVQLWSLPKPSPLIFCLRQNKVEAPLVSTPCLCHTPVVPESSICHVSTSHASC